VPFGSSATADAIGLSMADLARAIAPYCPPGTSKPAQPKEAFEAALRAANRRVSPAVYQAIAKHAGLTRCADPASDGLREFLREHFAAAPRGT